MSSMGKAAPPGDPPAAPEPADLPPISAVTPQMIAATAPIRVALIKYGSLVLVTLGTALLSYKFMVMKLEKETEIEKIKLDTERQIEKIKLDTERQKLEREREVEKIKLDTERQKLERETELGKIKLEAAKETEKEKPGGVKAKEAGGGPASRRG